MSARKKTCSGVRQDIACLVKKVSVEVNLKKKAKVELAVALKAIGLHPKGRAIFNNYPPLEVVCELLVEVVSPQFPGTDEPLLHECLRSGIAAHEKAVKERSGDQYYAFLAGLIEFAPRLLDKRLGAVHRDKTTCWIPLKITATEFIREHEAGRIEPLDEPYPDKAVIEPDTMRYGLAQRILDTTDFNVLFVKGRGAPLSPSSEFVERRGNATLAVAT